MLIFLHGPDTFRSRKKLKELKEKFLKEVDASGLNIETIDASHASWEDIEKALFSTAFLAKKRMVIFERALTSKPLEKNFKQLADILQKTTQEVIVVFWEEACDPKKLKNNALFDLLKKQKYSYAFDELTVAQKTDWIQKEVVARGGKIETHTARMLTERAGEDSWNMHHEIEKLVSYANTRAITAQDILELTQSQEQDSVFQLTDAILEKNKKRALELSSKFLQEGMGETELLSACLWQVRTMIILKSASEDTLDSREFPQKFSLHPFVVKKNLSSLREFTLDELKSMYQKLLAMDEKIKTGQKNFEVLFDLFLLS